MNEPTAQPATQLYDYGDFVLMSDGTCLHKGRAIHWYKNEKNQKPMIPAKRRSFVSLVKWMERDGEISYA